MVKTTGPDLEKIVDTIERFGPGFDYLVTAYPPFLKHLRDALDARGFDWERVPRLRRCRRRGHDRGAARLPGEALAQGALRLRRART